MSQSDPKRDLVLQLDDIRKVYRLYNKPAYRVLDLFGLCPKSHACFTEHAALDGVSLKVQHGEKVAIIGRNGAGKSTLLKIVTGTIQPTSGDVRLQGKVSALLQIGTGFQKDFTGRQNAYSAMALQGITGKEAHKKFEEIVDFAELEEYIDQPMKTYSTGMCARLMFSAAIVVTPDILVVDEVLGVGDAYFTHKSFDRMRAMCAEKGTTLLLVTHDVYSAMHLCDRFVWLDRGQVKLDADAKTVVNAYELSIKEQEEDRLRRRNSAALATASDKSTRVLFVRLANRSGFALPSPLALRNIELIAKDGRQTALDVAAGSSDWSLLPEGSLGPVEELDGAACRVLKATGSIYHKAEWAVTLPRDFQPAEARLQCSYDGHDEVELRIGTQEQQSLLRGFFGPGQGWRSVSVSGTDNLPATTSANGAQYGNGLMRIESVRFTDASGRPTERIPHGAPLRAELKVIIAGPIPTRRPTFVMAFHKPGVAYSAYCFTDRLELPEGDEFLLTMEVDSLLLGSGNWLVTVALAEENFYNTPASKLYFAVNDKWHHVIARAFELAVEPRASLDNYAFYVQPARFKVRALASPARALEPAHAT